MTILLPPAISIIVPVLRESGIISRTVAHLVRAAEGCSAEVIVVDGDPEGSTIRHVTISEKVRTMTGPCGRGPQMNAGAKAASGALLLFVHADTRLPEGAIRAVLDTCLHPDIAGGAFLLGIDNQQRIYRLIEVWANLRSRLVKTPYGDQAIFIKKRVFEDMGGYAHIPLMEDLDLMERLKQGGYKIALIRDAVRTSSRRWEKQGVAYGILRNNLLSGLFYVGVDPFVLKRFYD